MTTLRIFLALPISLALLAGTTIARADDELPTPPSTEQSDGHISWHEYQHELANYPMVTSQMDDDGVVWIRGHVDSGSDRSRIEQLARQIRGATNIQNQILTD